MVMVQRRFQYGSICIPDAPVDANAPYLLAGRQMYALALPLNGNMPIGDEHLVGLMGGIWAHPMRIADGFDVDLCDPHETLLPMDDLHFRESLNAATWQWYYAALQVVRRDTVLPAAPVYHTEITIHNGGELPFYGLVRLHTTLSFHGCWFGAIDSGEASYHLVENLVVGQDGRQPEWGIALGSSEIPAAVTLTPLGGRTTVTLRYQVDLAPGESCTYRIVLAAAQRGGYAAAKALWSTYVAQAVAPGELLPPDRPMVVSEVTDIERDVALAQLNLAALQVDYPDLGRYFLAGLPEYPQLFGCDTTYTIPGAAAAGFGETCGTALQILATYARRACGRIPHEITTNGRVFHPGNIQETAQFTLALWDYLRWSGDLVTVRQLFPICREGMCELIPAHGGIYPVGDGMVERLGMGARKLDSACYYIAGLRALAQLAHALNEPSADAYMQQAALAHSAFERDWWLESEGLYADSMHRDGRLQLDGHWTLVLPVQLGIADPQRAVRVMECLERDFVNAWGLVHTRHTDERVWTLPTGLMALAAFRQGRAELGLALSRAIAQTTRHGSPGCFKELIPQGLCFVQLWSAALYVQAIVEGLLGLNPDASAHRLEVTPCLPAAFPEVQIRNLSIGSHRLNLTITPDSLHLEHLSGSEALIVAYAGKIVTVTPGASFHHNGHV